MIRRVRKNVKLLPDKCGLGWDEPMSKFEGKPITVEPSGKYFRGEGYSWNEEWFEPMSENEEFFAKWKNKG